MVKACCGNLLATCLESSRATPWIAALAAEALLENSIKNKEEAESLLKQAQLFDKQTQENYRKVQLEFTRAKENASAIITQLRCINAKLPLDINELLELCEEAENPDKNKKEKKSFFTFKKK